MAASVMLATLIGGLMPAMSGVAGAEVNTSTLLKEMLDLRRLSKLPEPAYITRQFSSYDRASVTPADHTTWFANLDGGHFITTENHQGRVEYVMMDTDGPGAIVQIWSANPAGRLRIYIDHHPTPVVDAPMAQLLGGQVDGFPVPIAGERSKGWNLYFPIAYAKHCKLTGDVGGFCFHVNYRTYAAGTSVKSFSADQLLEHAVLIEETAGKLARPATALKPDAGLESIPFDVKIAAGEEKELYARPGPGLIDSWQVSIEAPNQAAAARGVVLLGTFDGQQTIASPLGDFFGTEPGLRAYESLPLGISDAKPAVLWCRWPMPYATSARWVIRNLTQQEVRLHGRVTAGPCDWSDQSLLFHAKWRIERNLPTRPFSDWRHLECKGQGRFVGGALHIINPSRAWWGEGDEKIYVDGEKFPSFFGTGTEDYYGYAWCSTATFMHAYHTQTRCDGPDNYGNTSVSRFHILDDVPFTREFIFDLENWHWLANLHTTRATVSFWYARPGGSDFFKPITAEDVRLDEVPPYRPTRVAGAIEGEDLKILSSMGKAEPQDVGGMCSNDLHLWWTQARPKDRLVVAFQAAQSGPQEVLARFVKAVDYGQVQLYINDRKAGEVLDFYNDGGTTSDEINLGRFDLHAGENTLTAEIVGAHPKAVKSYMFGLDYIRLK